MILLGIHKAQEIGWGTQQAFRQEFVAAALQARGWAVLAVAHNDPTDLRIFALDAHDLGAVYGYCPLLVIDVYEHAYWMDFGTDKASYVQNIMGYVNWGEVDQRLQKVHPPKFGYGALNSAHPIEPMRTTYSYDRSK